MDRYKISGAFCPKCACLRYEKNGQKDHPCIEQHVSRWLHTGSVSDGDFAVQLAWCKPSESLTWTFNAETGEVEIGPKNHLYDYPTYQELTAKWQLNRGTVSQ